MLRLLACLALVPTTLHAQQTAPALTASIIAEGRPLSSALVTPVAQSGTLGSHPPSGTRIHEAFLEYEGRLFLCYFTGNPETGTAPYARCFGR